MPLRFNSPQRGKARCFAKFASIFGSVAFSSVVIRTSNAAVGSSPPRQIFSVSTLILSSVKSASISGKSIVPLVSACRTSLASQGSFVSKALICELIDEALEKREIQLNNAVCVSCGLVIPKNCPTLADELCADQFAEARPRVLQEYGID